MKKTIKILSLILVFVLCFSMMACASFGSVEKTLNELGYIEMNASEEGEQMQEESEIPVTPHFFSNAESISALELYKLTTVVVFEFKSTDDMIEFYKDSDTLQGLLKDIEEEGSAKEFYNELRDEGFAKGNCLIIPIGLDAENVLDAFDKD